MPVITDARGKLLARIAWPLVVVLLGAGGFVACGTETGGDAVGGSASGGVGAGASSGGSSANGGSGQAGSNGGSASGGGGGATTCPNAECGPALGLPNMVCADGSVGGPTGRCLRLDAGGCGWEVRTCPAGGEGGGGQGGAGSSAGGSAAGGAAGGGDAGAGGAGGAAAVDRCGGCNYTGGTPEICIFQAGGPGPGRFVCATQNPCGAAGACACIVNQGTCGFGLEGGSPGYCVCDNGID